MGRQFGFIYGWKRWEGVFWFKSIRWRLDYDEKIGVHYNLEDFSRGKGGFGLLFDN